MDSNKILFSIVVGLIFGVFANLISWLLEGESSPFYEFFLQNVRVPNIWMMLNFPAFMALVLTGARSFAAGLFTVFLQWFIIGFFGNLVIQRVRDR